MLNEKELYKIQFQCPRCIGKLTFMKISFTEPTATYWHCLTCRHSFCLTDLGREAV